MGKAFKPEPAVHGFKNTAYFDAQQARMVIQQSGETPDVQWSRKVTVDPLDLTADELYDLWVEQVSADAEAEAELRRGKGTPF